MCNTDGETCDVWLQQRVRAAKVRKCYECGLPIPKGRDYIRTKSLYEGQWNTNSVHPECDALADFIRKDICEAAGEHGFIELGGLRNEIGNLSEYGIVSRPNERDEVVALGLDPYDEETGEGSTAEDVCNWIWDIAKDQYREVNHGS